MLRHENTILGILKLRELTDFVSKNKEYVFESNIRQWMQFKTTVNKGLRETLQTNPGKFFFYNNGITIVVSDFTELGENMIELFAPQIVNGAQTSNSILDHSKRTKNMEGSMTVTIIKADDEQEQNKLKKYHDLAKQNYGLDQDEASELVNEAFLYLKLKQAPDIDPLTKGDEFGAGFS